MSGGMSARIDLKTVGENYSKDFIYSRNSSHLGSFGKRAQLFKANNIVS